MCVVLGLYYAACHEVRVRECVVVCVCVYLDTLGVLFIKGANVKSICCVHLSSRWDQRRRVLEGREAERGRGREGGRQTDETGRGIQDRVLDVKENQI